MQKEKYNRAQEIQALLHETNRTIEQAKKLLAANQFDDEPVLSVSYCERDAFQTSYVTVPLFIMNPDDVISHVITKAEQKKAELEAEFESL